MVNHQGVDVVSDLVQQGSGQAPRAEDLGPLIEGQVGGYQGGAPLVLHPWLEYLKYCFLPAGCNRVFQPPP